jgi:hypothetical protein
MAARHRRSKLEHRLPSDPSTGETPRPRWRRTPAPALVPGVPRQIATAVEDENARCRSLTARVLTAFVAGDAFRCVVHAALAVAAATKSFGTALRARSS